MKNSNMKRLASKNGRWQGGKSSIYRRNLTNAKPGEIVHHIDGNKSNNTRANFEVEKPGIYKNALGNYVRMNGYGRHNQKHKEKSKK